MYHKYLAFGLNIHSEFLIPDLPRGDGVVDLTIEERGLDPADIAASSHEGGRLRGNLDDQLLFEVADGERITVHRIGSVSDESVSQIVTGTLLAVALRQRGLLTIHASAVVTPYGAVAFAGESKWGKSTLAEIFLQRGYEVLCDDKLVLSIGAEEVLAFPGSAHLRIRPDVGEKIVAGYHALQPAGKGAEQRHRTFTRSISEPVPLTHLFLLDPEDAAENHVKDVAPQEAAMALVGHTWGKYMFWDHEYRGKHLIMCADVVKKVPVQRLRRRRTLEALGDHVELVLRTIEARAGEAA